MRILLIGPPGSGKGTIGRMLSERIQLPFLSTGQLLRDIDPASDWYEPVNHAMETGALAPISIVGGLLDDELSTSRYESGFVLDGWLRQLVDKTEFDPRPDIVLYLNIPQEVSRDRILQRRVCTASGHNFNLVTAPPKQAGVCDIDGSKLVSRADDTPDVFNRRWQDFQNLTLPVIEQFERAGKIVEVDATPSPSEILEDAARKIAKFKSQ